MQIIKDVFVKNLWLYKYTCINIYVFILDSVKKTNKIKVKVNTESILKNEGRL